MPIRSSRWIPFFGTFEVKPTDLVYLYEDCKRCFYDTVRNGFRRPSTFSQHFTSADRAMRDAFPAEVLHDLGVGPKFRVIAQGLRVRSQPILFAEQGIAMTLKGEIDALVTTEHGEVFVVDYKTTKLDDGALMRFRRQVASYALCLALPEHPSPGLPTQVDGTALYVFNPSTFAANQRTKHCGLHGPSRWLELPMRDDLFAAFLGQVAELLGSKQKPKPPPNCGYCALRFGEREVA